MPRYNHMLDLGFTIETSTEDPYELTQTEVLTALLARVKSLVEDPEGNDFAVGGCIGFSDTFEIEEKKDGIPEWLSSAAISLVLGYVVSIERVYDDYIYLDSEQEGRGVIELHKMNFLFKEWMWENYSFHTYRGCESNAFYATYSVDSSLNIKRQGETEFEAIAKSVLSTIERNR